jgi:hypothetical protein
MSQGNQNIEYNRLHKKVLYVVADDERKGTVSTIFYIGWVVSGLVILFLALNYGGDAAMMALLTSSIAGSVLWLINNRWKHRLLIKYSPNNKVQRQLYTE